MTVCGVMCHSSRVRIAELRTKCGQLLQCDLLGLRGHPGKLLNASRVGGPHILHESEDFLFCLWWKVLLHVQLPRHLTQPTVECGDGTLPALTLLRLSAEGAPVEIEPLGIESSRQHICIGRQVMVFKIGVPALDGNLLEQLGQSNHCIE